MSKHARSRRTISMLAAAATVGIGFASFTATPASAHNADEKATFFEYANEGWGYLDVDAGSAVSNLQNKYTCWWFGCPTFDNKISSVTTRGSAALLFEHPEFGGRVVCVQPHSMRNMSSAGFDNQASSVLVRSGYWSRGCPTTYNGTTVTILG